MSNQNKRWNLHISYKGGPDYALDDRIGNVVGFIGDGGSGQGGRDLDYDFVEKSDAEAARTRVLGMNETIKLTVSNIRDMSKW